MAQFIQIWIKFRVRFFAVCFSRDNRVHSCASGFFSNFFWVVTFITYEVIRWAHFFYYFTCNLGVVDLTPSDFKIDRISMRIGGNMNLCSSSSSGLSNGSLFSKPSSTRMLMSADVTSIGEYPFRINFASYIKKKSAHKPFNAQRLKRLYAVFHGHNSFGISRHGAPVRSFHKMASMTPRSLLHLWQPWNRIVFSSCIHISSVSTCLAICAP